MGQSQKLKSFLLQRGGLSNFVKSAPRSGAASKKARLRFAALRVRVGGDGQGLRLNPIFDPLWLSQPVRIGSYLSGFHEFEFFLWLTLP